MAEHVVLHRHVAGENEESTRAVVMELAVADDDIVRIVRPVEENEAILRLVGDIFGERDVVSLLPFRNALGLDERAEESCRRVVAVAELEAVALPRLRQGGGVTRTRMRATDSNTKCSRAGRTIRTIGTRRRQRLWRGKQTWLDRVQTAGKVK